MLAGKLCFVRGWSTWSRTRRLQRRTTVLQWVPHRFRVVLPPTSKSYRRRRVHDEQHWAMRAKRSEPSAPVRKRRVAAVAALFGNEPTAYRGFKTPRASGVGAPRAAAAGAKRRGQREQAQISDLAWMGQQKAAARKVRGCGRLPVRRPCRIPRNCRSRCCCRSDSRSP